MADKIPEARNGGNGSHSYGVQPSRTEGSPRRDAPDQPGSTPTTGTGSWDVNREGQDGRYWTEARERTLGEDRDRRPLSEQELGAGYPRDNQEEDFYRQGRRRGSEEFEHGRAGFRDFGTPSPGTGRELRSYQPPKERDFNARDDRYAGRSGSSFHPEDMGPSQQWRPPEEQWERTHRPTQRQAHEPQRRGHLWEREPATARDIMTPNPRSVRRDSTLREVAIIMRDESCGIVPVVDPGDRLVGLITDRDIVMRTIDSERPWQQLRAEEVMSDDVECATPDDAVERIIRMMGKKQVRRVPVIDRGDRLIGMISMADVANRANEDEELQHALDKISKKRSFWSRLGG